jgi:hypothetical protein
MNQHREPEAMILNKFEIIDINELLRRLDKYNHKELHVHHTWKPVKKSYNGKNGLQLQEGMRDYHVNTKGWQDIGQHVTLLPDGMFVTGRDFSISPASIEGHNTGAFACEMIGNFDIKGTGEYNDLGYDKLEGKQKESMLQLARYFYEKGRYIRFHRENAPKTCPGTSIDKNTFMKEVVDLGKVFKDVDDSRWSAKYIEAAKNLDLISGNTDGTFNPEGPLSREQAAVLLVRLYEKITGKKVV